MPKCFENGFSNLKMTTKMDYFGIKEQVSLGVPFTINFEKRTLKLGKKLIDLEISASIEDTADVLENIVQLYDRYKHSIPGANEPSRTYFKALRYDELSQDDQTFGEDRNIAQFDLEYYILESIINGSFKWVEDMGKWFWQCHDDKDLVILRSWVE